MKLYNSLTRQKEDLPLPPEASAKAGDCKELHLFVCGPTVYDDAHIGHARTYIFFDFLVKYLRSQGRKVFYLQNITDVDDKIIKRAAETGVSPAELAAKFTQSYFDDMKALGVDSVTEYAPATKFIPEIIGQVERLIEKGFAYKIDGDGWYFDIAKDADYGKLSGRTVAQAEDGVSRIDEAIGKRNKGDFCLWKSSKPDEPMWPSEKLGAGRPGWHIEDTAISEKFFGPQYDIHGGAMDLKFPHHEAEIAQQESASGKKPFVRLWLHTGFLTVNGEKMSKSLGNFITIKDFLKKYPAEVFRYLLLGTHYRNPLDYSEKSLEAAKNSIERLYRIIYDYSQQTTSPHYNETLLNGGEENATLEEYEKQFNEAIADDLNAPQALAVIHEMLAGHGSPIRKLELIKKFDGVLNLGLNVPTQPYSQEKDQKIAEKVREYAQFRANKQFVQSDALRKEIEALGYSVRDTENGPYIVKKFF
jgi:cysteinyl-tRNA synthetase